jgi:hypothetical protein
MGEFQNSWFSFPTAKGAKIENNAPHAGIIEAGARPHKVNADGRAKLLAWVLKVIAPQVQGPATAFTNKSAVRNAKRYLRFGSMAALPVGKKARDNVDAVLKEAESIVYRICARMAKEQTPGHWIVRNHLDDLRYFLKREVTAEIKAAAGAVAVGQALASLGAP